MAVGTGASVFLVLVSGAFFLATENPAGALARLRGESVTVEPLVSDVGDGTTGEHRSFDIRLMNQTERPVRVTGGTTSCGCSAAADLPIALAPGESRPIRVEMTFGGSPGTFQHRFILHTDDENHRVVIARFSGRVVEAPAP
jgi:hypothetical protein